MRTGFAKTIASIVACAALAGTAPCLGQDLNIEIPLPELGGPSPAGKETGKRKLSFRGEDAGEKQRMTRSRPADVQISIPDHRSSPIEPRPSLPDDRSSATAPRPTSANPWPSVEMESAKEAPTDLGPLPDSAAPLPTQNKPSRLLPQSRPDAASRYEPSWDNPVGIPMRQRPLSEPEAASSNRAGVSAAKSPVDSKASGPAKAPPRMGKNRSVGKEPIGRGAWLSRWFETKRRADPPTETPQVARRHRASSHDDAKELAPPFSAKPRLPAPLDLESALKPYRD